MIIWNVFLLIALAVAAGVAFSIGSTLIERLLIASVLCGIVVYVFYWLSSNAQLVQ